ncbi:MAG: LysR family transcriptional regulator [Clostridiales bacterium]|nr:LysR family transcriptional regulator [Clostridiales bacterium]
MINFLNLEYFLVAAEELNFTKAAKRLFISQQSLSNHISNMEKEFQVILFNRTTPLTLTYAGQALKARAQQLIALKDETYKELADIKDFSVGQLTIGLSHTRGRRILPEVLPTYKERFPNIDLKLVEGNSSELARDLLHGDIDLLIDLLPIRVEQVETVPICAEEILLVVPNLVLERQFPDRFEEVKERLKEHTDLSLLRDCPFLLLHEGNRVRSIANELFEEAQMSPKIVLETENIETILALAMKGMGIIFYPRMFISEGQDHMIDQNSEKMGLNFYPLDHESAHRMLAIGYHKGHYMSQAAREFIQIVKERA